MNWTDQQKEAISARNGQDILLSAAAGSGKTAVLVERALSLIREGAGVEKMLVVTFTRAAASDMRQKLVRKLTELARTDARAREQAELVSRAMVCTIHAFCADLIRNYFQAADVDPGFRIMDGTELRQLEARALESAVSEFYAAGGEAFNALTIGREPRDVGNMARQLHDIAMARPDPWEWMDDCVRAAETGGGGWDRVMAETAGRLINNALALTDAAIEICIRPEGPGHYADALMTDRDALSAIPALPYEDMRLSLEAFSFTALKGKRGTAGDALAERVKALREHIKALFQKAQGKVVIPYDLAMSDARESAAAISALCRLTRSFSDELDKLKAERGALSYADLEQRALLALNDPTVAESARGQYEHIMIDEYQDVSDTQEAILQRIAKGGNVFMVGDVKQSIYRFRLAEPGLFLRKQRDFARGDGGRLIALNNNFRSRPGILAFVNAVFERAMRGGWAEIEYDDTARLSSGSKFEGEDAPVELCLIPMKDSSQTDAERDEYTEDNAEDLGGAPGDDYMDPVELIAEMKAAEREGSYAARRIRELLGTEFYDIKAGVLRKFRYRDFAVLSRASKGALPVIQEVFIREGIPAYADSPGGYFDVIEVRLMLSLMELLLNRRRDIAWIAVLRSPIVGLTSVELSEIRVNRPEGPYSEAVTAYAEGESALSENLRSFIKALDRWRVLSRAEELPNFVTRLFDETGFYAYAGALPGGAQRQANLDALITRAAAYDVAHGGGLHGFLEYVQSVRRAGEDADAAHLLGEEDDVARLMTVHKSKGLEFPVVICVQLGRLIRERVNDGDMCAHRALGIGIKHIDRALYTKRDTLIRLCAAVKLSEEALAEELRIFYVMLTRASDRLILIAAVKGTRENASARLAIAGTYPLTPASFLDIAAPAVIRMPGGAAIAPEGEAPAADASLPRVDARWAELDDLMPGAADGVSELYDMAEQPPDAEFIKSYAWRYPHEGDVLMPLKLSVSGLVREVTGPGARVEIIPRPLFMSEAGAMTAAERGSAMHVCMQRLDIAKLRGLGSREMEREIKAQLDYMAGRGILTPAARGAVDANAVARFFLCDLGQRALRSDELHREWTFNLKKSAREATGADSDERMLVQGAIDMCFLEEGAWVLVDYKTDSRPSAETIEGRYKPQLDLYAEALKRLTGRAVSAIYICLLRSGEIIPVLAPDAPISYNERTNS